MKKGILGFVAGFILALIGIVGTDFYNIVFKRAKLDVSQKWEVFSLIYAGGILPTAGQEESYLNWYGAVPRYQHTVSIKNYGRNDARDVKVQITGLLSSHDVFIEPEILGAEIGPLEPIDQRVDIEGIPKHTTHARIVRIPVVSRAIPVNIITVAELTDATPTLTKATQIVSANAKFITTSVDESYEQDRLNRLGKLVFGVFPSLDRSKWESSEAMATIHFTPDDPLLTNPSTGPTDTTP